MAGQRASIVLFYIWFHLIQTCVCQDLATYTAKNVSTTEWNESEKVQTQAKSAIECGLSCMMKYSQQRNWFPSQKV